MSSSQTAGSRGCMRGRVRVLIRGAAVLLFAASFPPSLAAQETTDPIGVISAYAELIAHAAAFDGQSEIQDNGSKIGVDLSTGEDVRFFAGIEVGVSLISPTPFNAGAATGSGAFTLEEDAENVFAARLGFLGVDFGSAGRVSFGKQASVYYDVASYATDQLNVFGGDGSQAYTGGSDGGRFGTGRADQALMYRVGLLDDRLQIGAQTQLLVAETTGLIDGAGLGIRLRIMEGLTVGAAYNRAVFNDSVEAGVRGLGGGDAEFGIVGVQYSSDFAEVGLVASRQENGDVVRLFSDDDSQTFEPVFFDASGFELFARINPGRFSVLGGFSYNEPKTADVIFDPGFVTRYVTLGGEYHFESNAYAYAEWRIDDSVAFDGVRGFNVFSVGLRYGFRVNGRHATY